MDASTSPFFELEALARPVPDLASTLTTAQAEQDANDANVSFLRTPISDEDLSATAISDDIHVLRRQIREERENRAVERSDSDSDSRRRMRQVEQSLRLRQMEGSSIHRRYGPIDVTDAQERISTAPRASTFSAYHGWAPSADSGRSDPADWSGLPTMSRSSADFYNEQRRAIISASRHMNSSNRDSNTAASRGGANGPNSLASDTSLRTAALLQSVRRNPTSSARTRSIIHNQLTERDRSGLENELRNQLDLRRRPPPAPRAGRQQREQSPSQMASSLHDLARRDWILNSHQRQQQEEDLRNRQVGSEWHLEDAIKYLERLRFCDSYQESVSSAAAGGFVREEFFTTNHDDFILDTAMIDPPAESSWLRVGGVFSGSQHATNGSTSFLRESSVGRRNRAAELPQLGQAQPLPTSRHSFSYGLSDPNLSAIRRFGRSMAPLSAYENAAADNASQQFRTLPLNAAAERSLEQPSGLVLEDRWPVKVKVHNVDYKNMTLAGTMEAFNVPDKDSRTQVSSITTFLEGEIVDFNIHTLETKNYKTDEDTDSIYWRMLEPFKNLTDDEMVRGLVSRKWMREQLREKYILMRWKGKLLHSRTVSGPVVSWLIPCQKNAS